MLEVALSSEPFVTIYRTTPSVVFIVSEFHSASFYPIVCEGTNEMQLPVSDVLNRLKHSEGAPLRVR
jgi:hypothetical protein